MVNNYDGYGYGNDGVKKDHIQRLWSWSKYQRYNGANSVNTESVRHLGPYRYKQNSLTYDSEGNLWALITDNYGRAYAPGFVVLSTVICSPIMEALLYGIHLGVVVRIILHILLMVEFFQIMENDRILI